MKPAAVHILTLFAVFSCLFSCGRKMRIIPRNDLAAIYAEFYVADRWADSELAYRFAADSSAYYETILKSHGYTVEDYRASVEKYLNDPERFSRILKKSSAMLKKQSAEMNKYVDILQEIQDLKRRAKELSKEFKPLDTLAWKNIDSINVEPVKGPIIKTDSLCVQKNITITRIKPI